MKKICVFLPFHYRGGTMQGAKNIVKMIHSASKEDGHDVELVFSCMKDIYRIEDDFGDLLELGVNVVETSWEEVDRERLQYGLYWRGDNTELKHESYLIPNDGAKNFADCDLWLIISDRFRLPVAPLVPYGMIVYDYIQRYLPDIFLDPDIVGDNYLYSARGAKFVMCTTPQTLEDANQFAGVCRDKLIMAPMEFNPKIVEPKKHFEEDFDYIIWTTNTTQHKNHMNVLEGIKKYYADKNGRFKVVITGPLTEYFEKDTEFLAEYTEELKDILHKEELFRENIIIAGELDENKYISVLSNAKFLMHSVVYDNGTYSVIEAAYYGVPSISSSYGQMKFINDRFKLKMSFFRYDNPEEIAEAMKECEENCEERAKMLPGRDFLDRFSYDRLAGEYWDLIKEHI